MKPHAGLADASGRSSPGRLYLDAEGREHVGRARFRRQRAIAVLGDLEAGAGGDDRGRRRNVVGAGAIAAGSDDVDRVGGRVHPHHLFAHDFDGAGDFVDGFAAHPQPHEESADLGRGGLARHHDGEGRAGFLAGERLPSAALAMRGLSSDMQTAPARSRKF